MTYGAIYRFYILQVHHLSWAALIVGECQRSAEESFKHPTWVSFHPE